MKFEEYLFIEEARASEADMKKVFNKNKKLIQKVFDKETKREEKALGYYKRDLQTRQGDDFDPHDFEEEEIEAERTAVTNTLRQVAKKIKEINNDEYWQNFFMRFLVG